MRIRQQQWSSKLRGLWIVAIVTVSGACSGDDTSSIRSGFDGTTPETSAPSTMPSTAAPASTAPGPPTTDPPATTAATTDVPAVDIEPPPPTTPDGEPAPTYAELEQLVADGDLDELDLALTAFTVVFGDDIAGAIPVTLDGSEPYEATSVVDDLRVLDDRLTDEQQAQIDATLDEIIESAVVIEVDDDPQQNGLRSAESNADSTPRGFSRRQPRSTVLTDDDMSDMFGTAETYIMGQLGGTRPNMTWSRIASESRAANQRNWLGWASTSDTEGVRNCRVVIVDFPDMEPARVQATVYHEYFHCWHGANYPGSDSEYWATGKWIKEGLAEWVESQASTVANSAAWATAFLERNVGDVFRESYGAVGFYWQINHFDGGAAGMWARIPEMVRTNRSFAAFEAATSGLSDRQLAQLASSSAQVSELDASWNFSVPQLRDGARPISQLDVRGTAHQFARAAQQVLVRFDFPGDVDDPKVVTLKYSGLSTSIWEQQAASTINTQELEAVFCVGLECVCDDGRNLFPQAEPVPGDDPRLTVGLTGRPRADSTVDALVVDVDDACNEGPPTDDDIAGLWVADAASLTAAFDEAYREIGITVNGAAGEMTLELRPDGIADIAYNDVRLSLDDPFVDSAIISGGGKLGWTAADGRLEFGRFTEFFVSVEMPSLGGPPITMTDEDLGGVDIDGATLQMDYLRDGPILNLSNVVGSLATLEDGSAGVIVFPQRWVRG